MRADHICLVLDVGVGALGVIEAELMRAVGVVAEATGEDGVVDVPPFPIDMLVVVVVVVVVVAPLTPALVALLVWLLL